MTVFEHLLQTYRAAEAAHPDLMEPYAQAITDADDREAMARAMRHALAQTIRLRFPLPGEMQSPPASAQHDSLSPAGPAESAVNPRSARNPQGSA